MDLTEEEKIRAAADIADAIYFLHGHSKVRYIITIIRLEFGRT